MIKLILAAMIALVLGCAGARIEPPYSEQELRAICERQGGWWRGPDVRGGFCEYESPGFI